ncbi:hypothetical protein GobsT_68720 [Gemmata obscuriglobus]|uniref:DUF6985 domain-containing protein n=1 Tax=Gemmata obscuriglobus TaxID=114 RepID=UPI00016C47FF|nr:ankyrin repeat domain-containing protein [Gemmata obscuriglobus]QEG32023.1 hypothetical protein GobsT_68720 [Gemmata obscuriglobus]VTS11373.1 unnamed protein product [Gemmata obscuriglobus UQM 2246]
MTHEVFGKLRFKEADESWAGSAGLPRFAAVGQMPEPAPLTEEEAVRMAADMSAALEAMKEQMRAQFGERVDQALAELDRAAEAPEPAPAESDPKDQEREQRRAARREKNAALFAKGRFPVRVAAPGGAEPSPAQQESYRFLCDNEAAVYDAVVAQVWESFQSAYEQEHWRQVAGIKAAATVADLSGRFAVTRVDIAREARNGFAHLVFLLESDWQDEHGMVVTYAPDTREAHWTSWEGLYDLLESDEPESEAEQEEYVPSPHDLLLEAILTGDEPLARELVARGADINALGEDEYPPLWISVDQIEVEEVRRLLAFGADPNLPNPDEKTTPLKHAKRMYRDMGFAPAKKRDALLDGMMSLVREAAGERFHDIQLRLEEIIRLLEAAAKTES